MDFSVEFYETVAGVCPVRDFLDELKASDLDDFAAVVAGLAKLRQRQISRLESPDYEGHSLANLRRVAEALHARVRVVFEPDDVNVGQKPRKSGD